jgi:hypothetical protein
MARSCASNTHPHSRGAKRPSDASSVRALENRGRRESRVPAAPAASRAKLSEAHERSHRGFTGVTRPSLRNGLTAYIVLSPVSEFVLSPSFVD